MDRDEGIEFSVSRPLENLSLWSMHNPLPEKEENCVRDDDY